MFKVTEYFFFMAWGDELAPLLSYVVELVFRDEELNERGRVLDADELKAFGEYVTSRCDHRHLNRQFTFRPTAETLARHFYEWIDGTQDWPLAAVRVTEAGRTAEYGHPALATVVNLGSVSIIERHYHLNVTARADSPAQFRKSRAQITREVLEVLPRADGPLL